MSHLYLSIPVKKEYKSYRGFTIKRGLFGFEYSNGIQMGMTGFDLDRVFEKIDKILSKNI